MSGTTANVSTRPLSLVTSKQGLTVVVSADLEGLVAAHHQAGLLILGMLQQSDITGTTLLPLLAVGIESEQLSAHLEGLLLEFFHKRRRSLAILRCHARQEQVADIVRSGWTW